MKEYCPCCGKKLIGHQSFLDMEIKIILECTNCGYIQGNKERLRNDI